MSELGIVTPKTLVDFYSMFTKEQKDEFLVRLGKVSTPYVPLRILCELSPAQQLEFSNRSTAVYFHILMPIIVQQARKLVREQPQLPDEQFDKELDTRVRALIDIYIKEAASIERDQIKQKRDRKSDPETIRRNVEICDLRKKDPTTWTQCKLAKHFKIKAPSIRKVLKHEDEWRKKASQLSTD
ncbi:MAG TPA: hypothetical protein VGZ47_22425 [Gemmataceae bacterium]|nr:hypothetical protein [Gemmataceae bacterium]